MVQALAQQEEYRRGRSRSSPRARENVKGWLFISPWLISLLVFTAYPILASFFFAMCDYSILNPPRWIGFQNIVTMFTKDPLYWKSVYNSAYYAFLAVPLQLAVAMALALLLHQNKPGVGIFRTIYYIPSLVPAVGSTLMWMFMLDPRNGLVNAGLRAIGLPGLGWLRSAVWSKPALIVMSLWGSGGGMLIFLAALKDIPQVYHEAAMVDGANAWERFCHITVPLMTPAIFFNLVMGIIGSFQVFASAFVAGGDSGSNAGPLNSLLMYMLLLYRSAFRYFQMGYASAMALVMFVVLVAITALLVKSSGRWVYYEGAQRR